MSMEETRQEMADMRRQKDREKAKPTATTPETTAITEHTVAAGDTLTHIAQKYYKSAERDKWMAIYEANKDIIGDNPSLIRVGQVLQIPILPT